MLIAGFPAGSFATNCYVVAPGRGEECVIIESMKMEMPVEAPHGGVVDGVLVAEGQSVAEGDALFTLSATA